MLDESLQIAQNRVVGIKQTGRALESGRVSKVYIAKDADSRVLQPILEMCKVKGVTVQEVASMAELGKACGIKVGAAAAAILKK
ncbi:MAG TPA: 50S ribosomal protein L7Ae-like protein [Peptococcaceae bacterium]|nr:50S ribosomal protein L7Ae-like protein [Peptococcaceae bacterium]